MSISVTEAEVGSPGDPVKETEPFRPTVRPVVTVFSAAVSAGGTH